MNELVELVAGGFLTVEQAAAFVVEKTMAKAKLFRHPTKGHFTKTELDHSEVARAHADKAKIVAAKVRAHAKAHPSPDNEHAAGEAEAHAHLSHMHANLAHQHMANGRTKDAEQSAKTSAFNSKTVHNFHKALGKHKAPASTFTAPSAPPASAKPSAASAYQAQQNAKYKASAHKAQGNDNVDPPVKHGEVKKPEVTNPNKSPQAKPTPQPLHPGVSKVLDQLAAAGAKHKAAVSPHRSAPSKSRFPSLHRFMKRLFGKKPQ